MKNGLPDHLRRLAVDVAKHEMGHYVVSKALGFGTGDVSLEITGLVDGHRGGADITLPTRLATQGDVESYLRRRVQVLYAGALAESLPENLIGGKVDNARAIEIIRGGHGAEQDHAKARELVHLIRNIRQTTAHPGDEEAVQAELTALDEELWAQATCLVELHADMIVGLACNLANRVQALKQKVVWAGSEIDSLPPVAQFLSTLPPAARGAADT